MAQPEGLLSEWSVEVVNWSVSLWLFAVQAQATHLFLPLIYKYKFIS